MIELLRRHPKALGFSLLLHALLIGSTLVEFSRSTEVARMVNKPAAVDSTIQAEVVDQKQLDKRAEKI